MAVSTQHLLSLLHSDVQAIVARAPQMDPAERQLANELALALAWNTRPRPKVDVVKGFSAAAEG